MRWQIGHRMTVYYSIRPPVAAGLGQINPQWVNLQLLLDVADLVKPLLAGLVPEKRSGYASDVFVLFQACIELGQQSPEHMAEWLNNACKEKGYSFQAFHAESFSNGKVRRYFPDQPALSRYLEKVAMAGMTEEFWNIVHFAHFILLRKLELVKNNLKMIVDVHDEPCKKDKNDPYCFGQKEGKTVYKTLVFSVISGELHQVIAVYKLKKGMKRLPLFEAVMNRLQANGFTVTYALVDREFYRKDLFLAFIRWKVTVITPGRKCRQTEQLMADYLLGKSERFGRGYTLLPYVRGKGNPLLEFDLLLAAKRKYHLDQVKRDFEAMKLSITDAKKRMFPLVVLRAGSRGITRIRGNEGYIRQLYRLRWFIEIAFREMNRLGISSHLRGRDSRLGILGAKALIYNIWQVQRCLAARADPSAEPLELNEFLGKTVSRRYYPYLSPAGMNP
jgi:hypothetical protein